MFGHNPYSSSIPDPERESFLGDMTRAGIVGGLMLALIMVAGEQVAERLDTALFGGILLVFGIFVHMVCNMLAVVTYGLGAALMVANLNPIVAVMAATGPLAPLWFFTNSTTSFGGRFVHYNLIGKDIREMSWLETFLVCLGGQIMNSSVLLLAQLFYFELPIRTLLLFKFGEFVAGALLPSLVVWQVGKLLKRRSRQRKLMDS
ncbi:MAG: hypothetical protein DWQ04_22080 [Chloroflexi bacterium]|nr:MAG: hypothetical protein DWQ04_22080 [Chloroflexota bacterium]